MTPPGREGLTLAGALLRRPALTALLLLGGLLLGAALPALRPSTPVARAVVLLAPSSSDGQDASVRLAGGSVREQAAIARLPVVVTAATRAVAGRVPEPQSRVSHVRKHLRVTVPSNTQRVTFAYTADDPAVARAVVEAAVGAYVDLRAAQVRGQADLLVRQMDRIEAELDRSSRTGLAGARAEVQRRRAQAVLARATPEAMVGRVQPTTVTDPLGVPRSLAMLTGLLAMLFPAAVVGHRLEAQRGRLLSSLEAREWLGAPALGEVVGLGRRDLALTRAASSGAADALRVVAASLPLRDGLAPPVVAIVDGTSGGATAGTTLANLAVAVAERQHAVLAVVRPGSVAQRLLGRRRVPGLVRVVAGDPWPPGPWDLVLLDCGALPTSGSSVRLAREADVAVAVVGHRSSSARTAALRERLDSLDLPCLGHVYLRPGRGASARRRRTPALRPSLSLSQAGR